MKKIYLASIAVLLVIPCSLSAQNAPFSLWGTGLDGSIYQQSVFYSDATNGLLIEGPLNSSGTKLPITFSWRGGNGTPLVLHPNGNVGIGTPSPTSNLQIGTLNGVSTSSPITLSLGATFSSTHGINPKLKIYDDGVNTWGLGVSSSQLDYIVSSSYDHVFYAGGAELTRIKSNGNIGIGTASPDQRLTVNGIIHSKEIKVDMNILPDYVFRPDYKLPTLAEVQAYIAQNQHLPEMPSAVDVAKDGLNLGDMNARLLKKVEELTLYLIEKDRQLDKQQKIVQSQQTQINKINKQLKLLLKKQH